MTENDTLGIKINGKRLEGIVQEVKRFLEERMQNIRPNSDDLYHREGTYRIPGHEGHVEIIVRVKGVS